MYIYSHGQSQPLCANSAFFVLTERAGRRDRTRPVGGNGVTACNFALKHVMSVLCTCFSLCQVRGIFLVNQIS
jgi:hypothetical protein